VIRSSRLSLAIAALGAASVAQAQIVQTRSINVEPVSAQMADSRSGSGRVNVMAVLTDPPLAAALVAARAPGAARKSVPWGAEQQRAYSQQLLAKQAGVVSGAASLGGNVMAQLTKVSNAVLISIDASQLPALARVPGVSTMLPVVDMTNADENTNIYVGATAVRSRIPSIDGSGVRIAILDSGIDFTHRNLGGLGTPAAYVAAYGASACGPTVANTTAPTWTSKVVGGYDFVGESWTNQPPNNVLQPDPNPIDCQGHGTSVADIAAGRSVDNTWLGMAPGAQLFAVKVCSAVATSCSGVAIVQGLEFALDPNADGDLSDAVDVVNMSLGANFGLRENASVLSSQMLTQFGVVVVASAGNGGDVPFINGSPSSTPESIAVAQTQVSGQFGYPLITQIGTGAPNTISNTTLQSWSETPTADITGPVRIDPNLASGGCAAYAAGFFAGQIALIRRGTCAGSTKAGFASAAGAIGVVIDNNAAGDPPGFGFGGGTAPFRSTLTITQAAGNALRAATLPITATISFAGRISVNGSMVASSSRGPNFGYVSIKPDIGAPGASVAASVRTGNGTSAFGGTSGAAPVVAGAAALMLQSYPSLQPFEVKARLMSAANPNVQTNPLTLPGVLAPVTRIGAGELRVVPAIDNQSAVWDASAPGATSLSFGYQPSAAPRVIRKRVMVRNYSPVAKTYTIGTSFRYADDQASGGVAMAAPASITVPANSQAPFTLQMTVNPAGLPVWFSTGVNGGGNAQNGPLLQSVEYDGYVTLVSGGETVRMPWHVLPRRSHQGAANASVTLNSGTGAYTASNIGGATAAAVDVFALTGTSAQLPFSAFPGAGGNVIVGDLRAVGVREVIDGSTQLLQFALSRFDAPSHPRPFRTVFTIDSNRDGTDDWSVTVTFISATTPDWRTVAFVQKLSGCASAAACPGQAYFFADVDLQSSNLIATIPITATNYPSAGLSATVITPGQPFNYRVDVIDWYFTGNVGDSIGAMTYTYGAPRFSSASGLTVPVGVSGAVPVNGQPANNLLSPSNTGLLLLWRDGLPGREASIVNVN